jgi:hypothetical protein
MQPNNADTPHQHHANNPRQQGQDLSGLSDTALVFGAIDRRDGLTSRIETVGWECDDIDVGNSSLLGEQHSGHDLRDDELRLSINK